MLGSPDLYWYCWWFLLKVERQWNTQQIYAIYRYLCSSFFYIYIYTDVFVISNNGFQEFHHIDWKLSLILFDPVGCISFEHALNVRNSYFEPFECSRLPKSYWCNRPIIMDPLSVYGGFLKWWYPTTMGFPSSDYHFGVFWGYHHLRKHPYKGLFKFIWYCFVCLVGWYWETWNQEWYISQLLVGVTDTRKNLQDVLEDAGCRYAWTLHLRVRDSQPRGLIASRYHSGSGFKDMAFYTPLI